MSSIVTSILSSTVGLLWNKARDTTAAKLKDGDVTYAKIREIVVRELSDIKTKLDGLSRKDLLSSYCFLKEGVDLLNDSLDKSKLEQKAMLNDTHDESGILNEALELPRAMEKVKINSDKEFESAKMRFQDARKKATEAFCNEALDIEDRIFAAKLRVVSEILECLESPMTAITSCLSFLQHLHTLPAVREIFSVYLNGGFMSQFNKEEREENVKSVMLINYVLFHFNFKFNRKLTDRLTWPGVAIELTDRRFNPVLDWQEVSTRMSWGEELAHLPNELILDGAINPYLSAVNSHGDVVAFARLDNAIEVICRTGESKVVKLPELNKNKVIEQYVRGFAIDNNNNVYVLRALKTRSENGDVKVYVLCVLDNNYTVTHHRRSQFIVHFLDATSLFDLVNIAINKNNDIFMIKDDGSHVYVCDNTGQLKYKFEQDAHKLHDLGISNKNEIMVSSYHMGVSLYTEEGNQKITIKTPEGHLVNGVAFHYLICKIIVLTYNREKDSFFLICYSEAGELETTTFFCNLSDGKARPYITSHPSGPVAVVRSKSITYI